LLLFCQQWQLHGFQIPLIHIYNNQDNEGHIFVKIQNEGDKPKEFKKGENIVQGIFLNYLTTDDEEEIKKERIGGVGSTNK